MKPSHRPICKDCGRKQVQSKGKDSWDVRCWKCSAQRYGRGDYTHHKYRNDRCEHCGFVPLHECQLDVDHIDGNRHNNNPANLQTLCANCHRLKTQMNEDWGESDRGLGVDSGQLILFPIKSDK